MKSIKMIFPKKNKKIKNTDLLIPSLQFLIQ